MVYFSIYGSKADNSFRVTEMNKDKIIQQLSGLFQKRKDIAFAYLFGSLAKDTTHAESDIDVGVYFEPSQPELEYESEKDYPGESELWSEIERLTGKQTDFVVLNRAPSTIFYSVMQEGTLLASNNEGLRSRMYNVISMAAEDFREFVDDYIKIMQRSEEEDRKRAMVKPQNA